MEQVILQRGKLRLREVRNLDGCFARLSSPWRHGSQTCGEEVASPAEIGCEPSAPIGHPKRQLPPHSSQSFLPHLLVFFPLLRQTAYKGTSYFILSHKNALREIVLLFLILQMRKLPRRKAKPPTQDHTACNRGSWWSSQGLGYPIFIRSWPSFTAPT